MTWSVYFVLSFSTVPVAGECTVSSCAVLESDESLQISLEEHGHRLETMNQNMCSAFEKLEATMNRTNARHQEQLCEILKTLSKNNMSVKLNGSSEKIAERPECHTKQEQEEYLSAMNFNLTSMIVRSEERIQAVNENLINVYQNLSTTLKTTNQMIHVQLQGQSSTLQTANRNLDGKAQVMNESVVDALREHDQKLQTMNETLSSSIDQINEKLNAIFDHVNENLQYSRFQVVNDCSDIKANGHTTSGVYRIYVVDQGQRYFANVFCDMTTTNGSWTVFQRRKDGSVDFYRGWNEYANGFGNPSGEFWLGNKFLHLLTSKRRYRLRIDLEDFEGEKRYAEYSTFNISSSADKYRLRLGNYSGTAGGDSLSWHNGQRFSTKDNDNDASSGNCAGLYRGAWWYNSCHCSNLNGLYLPGNYSSNASLNGFEGIRWDRWYHEWYSLKTTEMKISF